MHFHNLGARPFVAAALLALATALLPAAGRAQPALASPRADGLPAPATASGGTQGSLPRISANGRYVAFDSPAGDLVTAPPDANGTDDVFVRDLLAGTTTLVSVKADGTAAGNDRSTLRGMSSDGRYVLFESEASDLVSGDMNFTRDVFVRDLQSGVTTLVSVATNGVDSGNNMSLAAAMSPDGRFVLFSSDANNLVPTDTNGGACVFCRDAFVRDLQTAVTTLVSVDSAGVDSSNQTSVASAISDDGRYVTYWSQATNVVAGVIDGNNDLDVFRRDLQAGVTQLVSADVGGTATGNVFSTPVAMTADGRYVLFHGASSNLTATGDTNSQLDVFRRDCQTQTTALASVNAAGTATGAGQSTAVAISGDGRYVAFHSSANDLVGGDGGQTDGFVRDLQLGTTTLASVDSGGTKGNLTSLVRGMTPDARYVLLDSDAGNLAAGDLNGRRDVFVRDRQLGTTTLASVAAAGGQSAAGTSFAGTMTPDGRYVVVASRADDMVAADFNGGPDLFVRDLQVAASGVVSARASLPLSSTPSARSALTSDDGISGDGRFVAFDSVAADLVPVATRGVRQAYVRDLQRALTGMVSLDAAGTSGGNADSSPFAMSADGRYVFFVSTATDLVNGLVDSNGTLDAFVRDVQAGVTTLVSVNAAGTGTGSSFSSPWAITPSGRHALFLSVAANLVAGVADVNASVDVFVRDLQTATTTAVSVNAAATGTGNGSSTPVAITPNGRYVAFDSFATNLVGVPAGGSFISDVYVRDLQTGTTELVSVNGAGTAGGDASSSGAAISDDGRYVLFGSTAGNLGPTVTPGRENVFVRDRQTGTTILVSRNGAGSGDGNGRSFARVMSANGRYIAFDSEASDLVTGDGNDQYDVFVRDLQASSTTLVSVAMGGVSAGNGLSSFPTMSADGRLVGFGSSATDLVPGDTNGLDDAFVRDLVSGTTTLVSVDAAGVVGNGLSVGAVVNAAGTRAVFHSAASNLAANDLNFALDVFAAPFPAPNLPFADGFDSGSLIRWSGFRP